MAQSRLGKINGQLGPRGVCTAGMQTMGGDGSGLATGCGLTTAFPVQRREEWGGDARSIKVHTPSDCTPGLFHGR